MKTVCELGRGFLSPWYRAVIWIGPSSIPVTPTEQSAFGPDGTSVHGADERDADPSVEDARAKLTSPDGLQGQPDGPTIALGSVPLLTGNGYKYERCGGKHDQF